MKLNLPDYLSKELVVWERVYEPNLEHKKLYDGLKVKWMQAYETQLALVDTGVTTSMWSAPGL